MVTTKRKKARQPFGYAFIFWRLHLQLVFVSTILVCDQVQNRIPQHRYHKSRKWQRRFELSYWTLSTILYCNANWLAMVSCALHYKMADTYISYRNGGENYKRFIRMQINQIDNSLFYQLDAQILYFNPLNTKRRLLYLKTQSVLRCEHFSSRL